MQKIEEKTVIQTQPEKVWNFLTSLHEGDNYHRWHPKDHIRHWVEKGDMQTVGSEAYFEERLGTFTLKLRYRLTVARYPEYLEYEAAFPLSLFHAGIASFTIRPIDPNSTELTAYVEYGYRIPLIGSLIDSLISLFVHRADVEKHIREEGENMRQILI